MHNIDIRDAMKLNRVYGYEIAAALGIAESSFSRMMARRELTQEQKQQIITLIPKIKQTL